jgi:nitrogen PTS system EIIA component
MSGREMRRFPGLGKSDEEAEPIEAEPAETKPTETKPTETELTETEPMETEPIDVEPIEALPIEAWPIEAWPIEAWPIEAWQGPPPGSQNTRTQLHDRSAEASQLRSQSIDASTFEVASILRPEAVLPALRVRSRDQLFGAIGARAHALFGQDAGRVVDALRARERLASTAMGAGIAIPHARLPDLREPIGLFLRLVQPADFGAPDGQGVDLAFVLLSPQDQSALHLRTLARIARLLGDAGLCRKLRATSNGPALHALITEPELAAA